MGYLGTVVPDRAPVAAPKDEQNMPDVDPPNIHVLLVQPDGCLNLTLFPEGQDMLPALPTPDVLKELEALRAQCTSFGSAGGPTRDCHGLSIVPCIVYSILMYTCMSRFIKVAISVNFYAY